MKRPRRSPPQHSPVDSSCPSARSPTARTTGNQRRGGMMATAGATTWRHRRGAAPSSHEPGQPPPRLHVAAPRPAQPTPHPRPRSGPGAKEARHDRTSTQGRTQFVACGRDSPAAEPFGERALPVLQARGPAAAGRASTALYRPPARSATPPRNLRREKERYRLQRSVPPSFAPRAGSQKLLARAARPAGAEGCPKPEQPYLPPQQRGCS